MHIENNHNLFLYSLLRRYYDFRLYLHLYKQRRMVQ